MRGSRRGTIIAEVAWPGARRPALTLVRLATFFRQGFEAGCLGATRRVADGVVRLLLGIGIRRGVELEIDFVAALWPSITLARHNEFSDGAFPNNAPGFG